MSSARSLLVHSVSFASSAKRRCCVEKHVSTNVYFFVLGSYTLNCRAELAIGNSLAEGWVEPALQNSGVLFGERTRAVNQTRACSSMIGLCDTVWLVQIRSSPQTGDGCITGPGTGASASRTGALNVVAVFFTGSSTG